MNSHPEELLACNDKLLKRKEETRRDLPETVQSQN